MRLPQGSDAPADEGERRHLTVLFADLVDSSRLASLVDAEDWHHTVRTYQDTTSAVVARYDGHIAQFLGDGILVYFGYPRAHEDDTERALLAGLGILEALKGLTAGSSREPLAVRVGVHTGPVVIGRMGQGENSETLAIGHTMNVAARLQGIAQPNTVVASETTRRLAAGQFVTRDLGTPDLKGIAEGMRAHQVLQPSGVRSRLDVASQLTPFVGRDEELESLVGDWAAAVAGESRVALVMGEPGVGKSRLMLALRQRLADETHTWLECRCSPYLSSSALGPVRELLRQGLGFEKFDRTETKLAKLRQRIVQHDMDVDAVLPTLAAFLEIDLPAAAAAASPESQREMTMNLLVDWSLAMSADQPVLILIEDLHWCDPSSLEFLDRLMERTQRERVLVLMTARPEFVPPWPRRPNFKPMTLGGLTGLHARRMVEHLCAGSKLPREAYERIVTRADGVPLHVEELTKMLQEAGTGGAGLYVDDAAIPETLEGSLMARLDQLNETKRVAQVASIIGREFDYRLLETVLQIEPAVLEAALGKLVAAGLVFRRESAGEQQYIFKHALIQDASYRSLLRSQRRDYHARAAKALQTLSPSILADQPELVARHTMEAEDWLASAGHWLQAGLKAVRASANREAVTYLQAGMGCVTKLAESPARAQLELELLLTLGPPLMATRGYADEDVEKGYTRARELCRQLGEPPAVFPVLFGLWTYHCLRAKHDAGLVLATDLAQLAHSAGDESLRLEADLAMGANCFYLGDIARSRHHLARSISTYDATRDEAHRFLYGQDPRVGALGYEAFALWLAGQAEQAMKSSELELSFARAIGHPFSLTYALTFAAWFHRMRGDVARSHQLALELRQLATERGVTLYRSVGVLLCGSAMVERGQIAEGLRLLETGITEYRMTGSSVIMPYWHGLHADALRRAGRLDDAQATLERGFEALQQTGERWCEAELHRYRAVLLQACGEPAADVASTFERAIEVARVQGAVAWELRAMLGLFDSAGSGLRGPQALQRLSALRALHGPECTSPDLQALDALISQLPP